MGIGYISEKIYTREREKGRLFEQDLFLSPWKWGERVKRGYLHRFCSGSGDEMGGWALEEQKRLDLQTPSLLYWQKWPVG